MRVHSFYLAALACAGLAVSASAQVTFYQDTSQIVNVEGDATFDDAPFTMYYPTYSEDGLDIFMDHEVWHFFNAPGMTDLPLYYPNGGTSQQIIVTKTDGSDFQAFEVLVSNGWSGSITYVWVQAFLDGVLQGESDMDVTSGGLVGVSGTFDEIRIGAYVDPASRDLHDPFGFNALAADNFTYGTTGGGGFSLALSGDCPGRVTADASGATPGGTVAYVFGVAQGSTTIPGGPCAGTQLGIQGGVRLVGTDSADGSGNSSLSGNAPAGACGRYLQALDVSTCTTSNVAQIN